MEASLLAQDKSISYAYVVAWTSENGVNLRSGSIFVSLWKLHSGGHGETKREPDTNLLRNVCRPLFDWLTFAESANQNYFCCLFF